MVKSKKSVTFLIIYLFLKIVIKISLDLDFFVKITDSINLNLASIVFEHHWGISLKTCRIFFKRRHNDEMTVTSSNNTRIYLCSSNNVEFE